MTDVPATPTEGDPGQHYADVQNEPLTLSPEDQERIAEAIEEGEREVAESEDLRSLQVTSVDTEILEGPAEPDYNRPPYILTEVDGSVIGWDTCGECLLHIRLCRCATGPHQPRYIKHFKQQQEEREARLAAAAAERERKAAIVVADPEVVAAQVSETLAVEEERTPTGRRKRSDAGKPRGPRGPKVKKGEATPATVLEAAGDLSDAMKES